MSVIVDTQFNIKDIVYLKTDVEQKPRIITGICVRDSGINYELSCGECLTWHYDFEITTEVNVLLTSTN